MAKIHNTAIIAQGADIADDVQIGPFSVVGEGVKIEEGTIIASHCVIEGKTTIGKNNQIFSHSVLGTIPQDLKFGGEETFLIIGNNNKIREHTLINTGTAGGGYKTMIGSNNLIMGHVHIGHDCILADNIVVANSSAIAGHVEIDSNVVVGGVSAIHQFCKIGTGSMIGGGSIVVQDIPPYCITEGNRATLRGLNINGLRRRMDSRSDIDLIKKAYKKLFESGQPLNESAAEILESSENKFVKILANFVMNTKRGIPFTRK
ncbi:MAG: acyl-ACP--UDP-N-acetylglucosamine O-acyltransferase [Campylobacterota bacterium]|nr:acyl-ACP--UDP-N-acetylglucosamine O-acyltransferase [Campylobacterota bacterium]